MLSCVTPHFFDNLCAQISFYFFCRQNAAGNTAINLANEVPPDCFSHHDQVITVGASAGPANPNVRWANSSFGGAVNVFAPGQNIIGARHNNNNQYTGPLSGTSIVWFPWAIAIFRHALISDTGFSLCCWSCCTYMHDHSEPSCHPKCNGD